MKPYPAARLKPFALANSFKAVMGASTFAAAYRDALWFCIIRPWNSGKSALSKILHASTLQPLPAEHRDRAYTCRRQGIVGCHFFGSTNDDHQHADPEQPILVPLR